MSIELRIHDATDRQLLFHIISQMEKIMASLADVQAAVAAEDSVVDSAIALLQGLAAQIAALKPDQAAIDALAADVTAKTQQLADAVVANTTA
jgi:hypothetical protein